MSEDSDRYQSYVEGVTAYVVKPVEFDAFSEAVKALGASLHPIERARDERTTHRRSVPIVDQPEDATFFFTPRSDA